MARVNHIPLLVSVLIAATVMMVSIPRTTYADGDHSETRHVSSFSFNRPFFPEAGLAAVPNWEVRGGTMVTTDFIRLTPDIGGRNGYIVSRRAAYMKTFELTIHFRIHGSNPRVGADGMVFWILNEPLRPGQVLGGQDNWNGIAIIIDTFDNNNDGKSPSVSVHQNDGTKSYQMHLDGENTMLGTCLSNFRNAELSYLHIYYENGFIHIYHDPQAQGAWQLCCGPFKIDLPPRYYFGFSAATGGLSDNHDLMAFTVNTMDPVGQVYEDINPHPNEQEQQQQQQQQEQQQQQQSDSERQEQENRERQEREERERQDRERQEQENRERENRERQERENRERQEREDRERQERERERERQDRERQDRERQDREREDRERQEREKYEERERQLREREQRITDRENYVRAREVGSSSGSPSPSSSSTHSVDSVYALVNDVATTLVMLQRELTSRWDLTKHHEEQTERVDNQLRADLKEVQETLHILGNAIIHKNEFDSFQSTVTSGLRDVQNTVVGLGREVQSVGGRTTGGQPSVDTRGLEATLAQITRLGEKILTVTNELDHKQQRQYDSLNARIAEISIVVESNTSIGFWTYFVVIEALLVMGFFLWRSMRETKHSKLW